MKIKIGNPQEYLRVIVSSRCVTTFVSIFCGVTRIWGIDCCFMCATFGWHWHLLSNQEIVYD